MLFSEQAVKLWNYIVYNKETYTTTGAGDAATDVYKKGLSAMAYMQTQAQVKMYD